MSRDPSDSSNDFPSECSVPLSSRQVRPPSGDFAASEFLSEHDVHGASRDSRLPSEPVRARRRPARQTWAAVLSGMCVGAAIAWQMLPLQPQPVAMQADPVPAPSSPTPLPQPRPATAASPSPRTSDTNPPPLERSVPAATASVEPAPGVRRLALPAVTRPPDGPRLSAAGGALVTMPVPSLEPGARAARLAPPADPVQAESALPHPDATLPPPEPEAVNVRAEARPAAPSPPGGTFDRTGVSSAGLASVRDVLARYRLAYEHLDARSAKQIWPGVDERALSRAFDGLDSQKVTFDSCDVAARGERAVATCRGSASYVTRVGSRSIHTPGREWNFLLQKSAGEWVIASVETR